MNNMSIAKEPEEYAAAWLVDDAPATDEFDRAFEAQVPTAAERKAAKEALKVADASGQIPEASTLKSMSHAELYRLREKLNGDKAAQNAIAPYEHRAFAREAVAESPALAVPVAVAVPLYEATKLIGATGGRSASSLESMRQGFIGVGEGVAKAISRK